MPFYALNLSLDRMEGMFDVSPPFKITSEADASHALRNRRRIIDESSDTVSNDDDDDGDDHEDDDDRPNSPSSSITSSTSTRLTPTPTDTNTGTHPNNNETVTSSSSEGPSSTAGPLSANPVFNSGEISNNAIGISVALVAFGALGIVLYYRRKLAKKRKNRKGWFSRFSKNRDLPSKLVKAKAATDGLPAAVEERIYELDAQDEIREADSRMKPAELYPITSSLGS